MEPEVRISFPNTESYIQFLKYIQELPAESITLENAGQIVHQCGGLETIVASSKPVNIRPISRNRFADTITQMNEAYLKGVRPSTSQDLISVATALRYVQDFLLKGDYMDIQTNSRKSAGLCGEGIVRLALTAFVDFTPYGFSGAGYAKDPEYKDFILSLAKAVDVAEFKSEQAAAMAFMVLSPDFMAHSQGDHYNYTYGKDSNQKPFTPESIQLIKNDIVEKARARYMQ